MNPGLQQALAQTAANRPCRPQRVTCALRRLTQVLALLVMTASPLIAQSIPPDPSAEPWLLFEVEGTAEFSRFEVAFYQAADGSMLIDPHIPSSFPGLEIVGFIEEPWGERRAAEIYFDPAFWTDLVDLWGDIEDLIQVGGGSSTEQEDAITAFQQLIDSTVLEEAEDMLNELLDSLIDDAIVTVISALIDLPCERPYIEFQKEMLSAQIAHAKLLGLILTSPTTCLAPPPPVTPPPVYARALFSCIQELDGWVVTQAAIIDAVVSAVYTMTKMSQFMERVAADRIGTDLFASQANAPVIARLAKEVEQAARRILLALEEAQAGLATIKDNANGYPVVENAAEDESETIGSASSKWAETHQCLRDVIAPRFETSTVRTRFFVETEDGDLIPLSIGGQSTVTSLPRPLAKANVIEIDVEELYQQNPGVVSTFDERVPGQSIVIRVCEGAIIDADPGSLSNPSQDAWTRYWVGDFSFAGSCVSHWYAGIRQDRTLMVKPWDSTTVHRACENAGFIDNDNDAIAEAHWQDACIVNPQNNYPYIAGDAEEDIYLAALGQAPGKTAWTQHNGDMMCNGAALSLVSPDGLTDRVVRQEWVANTASCWTQPSDGKQPEDPTQPNGFRNHPKDSTQVRFALVDSSWGEPRPRGCYAFDPEEEEWVCLGLEGCPACHGLPEPDLGGLL